ncbi:MAG: hypothetical protein ACFFBD_10890 [Candidatus Hodarchaeota archaeon]
MNQKSPVFPIGYHNFHENQNINFELNRWHSLGYAQFEDFNEVTPKIKNYEDWKREMVGLDVILEWIEKKS